ncbi:MAG: hypothetical protein ING31_11355 [Burkholderiales bacterium]|nr:hypothetical protein [Burkholderiales bacterium]
MLLATLPVVLAGSVKPLPDDERLSGIDKFVLKGPWTITRSGLVGDAQADLKNHGGPEKALHQYPLDHYGSWKAEIGRLRFELEAPLPAALHLRFVDLQIDPILGVPDASQLFEAVIEVVGLIVENDFRQFVEIPHASSLCRP